MLFRTAIAVLVFACAFLLTNRRADSDPVRSPSNPSTMWDTQVREPASEITTNGLIAAAAGHFTILQTELDELRNPPEAEWDPRDDDLFYPPGSHDDPSQKIVDPEEATYRGYKLAKDDPVAAAEWLAGLEAGFYRDKAVGGFVRRTFKADPVGATHWASSIADPDLRERYLRVTLRRWKAVDPVAAEIAIGEAGPSQLALDSLRKQ